MVAPLNVGSAPEQANGDAAAIAGLALANVIGGPPGSPDASDVADARSSHGQYATGTFGLPTFVQYRRIEETTGWLPWLRRRSSPFAVTVTCTSRPDRSHACGQLATSPWNLYRRVVVSAGAGMFYLVVP